jgi:hypothetical protein
MTTSEITEAYQVGAVKLETFVFRAGMPTWVTLLEVPEIVEALAETGDEAALASRARRATPSALPPPRRPPAHAAAESADAAPHPLEQAGAAVDDASDGLASAFEPERATSEPERATSEATQGETEPLLAPLATPAVTAPATLPADSQAGEVSVEGAPVEPVPAGLLTESGDEAARQESVNLPPAKTATQSSGWVWLIVLALLIGAALALLAHRFGLKLR